jgi:hypothetical protein
VNEIMLLWRCQEAIEIVAGAAEKSLRHPWRGSWATAYGFARNALTRCATALNSRWSRLRDYRQRDQGGEKQIPRFARDDNEILWLR